MFHEKNCGNHAALIAICAGRLRDFSLTLALTLLNLLRVQNSISNWRRKQDDVPIDIQLILPCHISPS